MSDFCEMAETLRRMDDDAVQYERVRNRQRIARYHERAAHVTAQNPAEFQRRYLRGLNARDALLTFYPRSN